MSNHLKGMTDVFSRRPTHVQEPALICIYYDHALEYVCTCSTRSYREKKMTHINLLNRSIKQASILSVIYRCALKYKLQIASPQPVKVNVNPADIELSRLKDTNKNWKKLL